MLVSWWGDWLFH